VLLSGSIQLAESGSFGGDQTGWQIQFLMEEISIKEDQRAEGLVLGGCSHFSFSRKIGQKCLDFRFSHLLEVCLIVKKDVAPDLIDIRLFSPVGILLVAQRIADLIEQFLGFLVHDMISSGIIVLYF